jgi:hypothetical protein
MAAIARDQEVDERLAQQPPNKRHAVRTTSFPTAGIHVYTRSARCRRASI